MKQERILVVGVDAFSRSRIESFFQGKSVRIHFVDDEQSANWMLGAVPFSLVLVDETQVELAARIEHLQHEARRIVLSQPGVRAEGAQGILIKPLTAARLDQMLAEHLQTIAHSATVEQNWDVSDTRKVAQQGGV